MSGKLPADCFQFYLGLGDGRSYQQVANHYGVSKKAVTNRAVQERWQVRIERIELEVQRRSDEKAVESLEQMGRRHLKSLRIIQGKALETLRSSSLTSAMDAIRALDLAIKGERLVRGEPSDRTALAVEDVIKREYSRWMAVDDGSEEEDSSDTPSLPAPSKGENGHDRSE